MGIESIERSRIHDPGRRHGLARRAALVVLLVAGLAAGLTACGRKGSPEHPPGSDFPRTYPAR